jgi:hypothetical protein
MLNLRELESSSGDPLFKAIKYWIVIIKSRLVELQEVRIFKVSLYMCGLDCHVLGFVRANCKTGSAVHDWIYLYLIHTTRDYRQYSATTDLHTLQFTVTHTIGFSVFISRILETDL